MQKASMLDVMLLAVTVVVSTAVLFMPFLVARSAGADAWISVLVAGAAAMLPAWSAGVIMSRFPDKSFTAVLRCLLGGAGWVLALVYAAYFLFAAVLIVWQVEEFIVGTLMPETPEVVIRTLFLIAAGYAVISGGLPLLRTNTYVAPVGIVVIALVIGLPLTRMDPSFLLPVLENGYRPALAGAFLLLAWLCQIPFVMLVFTQFADKQYLAHAPRKGVLAVAITASAMLLGALGTLAAFGPEQTASMYYPSFAVARIISIGAFLEHIEVAFVAVWIAAMYITAAFYLQAVVVGAGELFGMKNTTAKQVFIGLLLAALATWPLVYRPTIYQLLMLIRSVAPWGSVALGGAVPVLLAVRALVMPPAGNGEKKNGEGNGAR